MWTPDDIPEIIQEEISVARSELDLLDMDYEKTLEVKLRLARAMFELEGPSILEVSLFLQDDLDDVLKSGIYKIGPFSWIRTVNQMMWL